MIDTKIRKNVKEGYDFFPKEANIPEFKETENIADANVSTIFISFR